MTTTVPELLVHCPTCRARPHFACVVLSAPELSAIGAEVGFFHEDRTAAAAAWVPPDAGDLYFVDCPRVRCGTLCPLPCVLPRDHVGDHRS